MRSLINKFSRITSTGLYLPEIDGLRFLAILWVFIFHLNGYLIKKIDITAENIFQRIAGNGYMGVELFFVISGFVLSLPFAKYYLKEEKKVDLKKYFIRRVTRIEPPYFLIMIFLFLFEVSTHLYTIKELAPHLAASLLYAHNIVYPGTLPLINSIAWSLEVEIQFYILVPLLAYIFILQKNLRRVLLLCTMIIIPVIQHYYNSNTIFFYQFSQYFVSGFLLADVYVSYDKQYFYKDANRIKRKILTVFGGAVFAGILLTRSTKTDLTYTIFIPSAILLFYFTVLFIPFWKRLFSIKWLSIIGGMCYTIYLLHIAVLSTFIRFFVKYKITNEYFVNFIIQFFIMGLLTMIFSSLFFYFIERPCMQKDWFSKLHRKIWKVN
jgi:peptidoglycan/LPS O-acetylase OafA/YrhL